MILSLSGLDIDDDIRHNFLWSQSVFRVAICMFSYTRHVCSLAN